MAATLTKRKAKVAKPSILKAAAAAALNDAPASTPAKPAEYRLIAVESLHPSPTNPRKLFRGIEELAASMEAHGVLEPLLARPWPADCATQWKKDAGEHLQLVAGERRLRAAQLAKLVEVPVLVRELSDKDVLEIQVIENDQREDVQPMDQAYGYHALIETCGYDVPALAAKTGRSAAYIYHRLQLTKLIKPLQDLLAQETIHFGHAVLLARLADENQKEMSAQLRNVIPSVGRMKDDIERSYHLDLHAATFPKDSADLVPKAGPCTTCPRRTGFLPELFPDVKKKDTCTDRTCFHAKEAAFVKLQVKKLEADGQDVVRVTTSYYYDGQDKSVLTSSAFKELSKKEAKKVPAKELKTAVVVDGNGVGRVMQVRVGKAGQDADPAMDRYREEQRRQAVKVKSLMRLNAELLKRISATVSTPPDLAALKRLARTCFDRLDYDAQQAVAKLRGWEKPKKSTGYGTRWEEKAAATLIAGADLVELHRFILEAALAPHVRVFFHGDAKMSSALKEAAEAYGVDVDQIRAELKAADGEKTKPARKKAGKASARAKGKRKAPRTDDAGGDDDADEGDGACATDASPPAPPFDDDAFDEPSEIVLNIPGTVSITVARRAGGRWAVGYFATAGIHQTDVAHISLQGHHVGRAAAVTAAADAIDAWLKTFEPTGNALKRAKEIRLAIDKLDECKAWAQRHNDAMASAQR